MMHRTFVLLGALTLATAACKKTDKEPAKTDPAPAPTPTPEAKVPGADDPAALAKKNADEIAAALTRLDAATAKEAERWTPAIEARAAALAATDWKSTGDAMTAILASEHRQVGNAARDPYRHPAETVAFAGITPTSNVIELGAGAGWYSELLAPLLAKHGTLTVVGPDPDGPADKMSTVYGQRLVKLLAKSPGLFGAVRRVAIAAPDKLDLGAPGSADVVIAFRELHNWVEDGFADAYLKSIHAVLKDGGILALEEHRAKPDAKVEDAMKLGYLPEQFVIDKVTAAGFELVEKSEINANPKDTKDYADGVWTLPPALRLGEVDRDKYLAIGESDRMTLKFQKQGAR